MLWHSFEASEDTSIEYHNQWFNLFGEIEKNLYFSYVKISQKIERIFVNIF